MCWGIWNWGGHQRPHHASPQHCDDPRTKHVLNSSVKVTPRQPGNLDLWTHLCYFALNDYVSILIFLVGQINVFMGPPLKHVIHVFHILACVWFKKRLSIWMNIIIFGEKDNDFQNDFAMQLILLFKIFTVYSLVLITVN